MRVFAVVLVLLTATAAAEPKHDDAAAALRAGMARDAARVAKLVAYPAALHDVLHAKPVLATAATFKREIAKLMQSDVVAELAKDGTVKFARQDPPAGRATKALALLGKRGHRVHWYTLVLDRASQELVVTVHAAFDAHAKLVALVWVLERTGEG